MKMLLMAAAAFGVYWAYRNGWGSWFKLCPPGYVAGSDMFPVCLDQRVIDYDGGKCGLVAPPAVDPHTGLVPPGSVKQYGCEGGKPVVVASRYPTWP